LGGKYSLVEQPGLHSRALIGVPIQCPFSDTFFRLGVGPTAASRIASSAQWSASMGNYPVPRMPHKILQREALCKTKHLF
jgi:hypothetical protein